MISWLKRCAIEGEDRFRYSPRVRSWLSGWQRLRHAYANPSDDQERVRTIRALAPPRAWRRRRKPCATSIAFTSKFGV